MDQSSNIFSYFVGGLALVSTTLSGILYFRGYLPSARMKLLDEVLTETKGIYTKTNAEGLLPARAAESAKSSLDLYEGQRDALCEVTYRAHTVYEKIISGLRGQTMKIMALVIEVEKLRAFLMTTQEREKARRRMPEVHSTVTEPNRSASNVLRMVENMDELLTYRPSPDFCAASEFHHSFLLPNDRTKVSDPEVTTCSWPSFSMRRWKLTEPDNKTATDESDFVSVSNSSRWAAFISVALVGLYWAHA